MRQQLRSVLQSFQYALADQVFRFGILYKESFMTFKIVKEDQSETGFELGTDYERQLFVAAKDLAGTISGCKLYDDDEDDYEEINKVYRQLKAVIIHGGQAVFGHEDRWIIAVPTLCQSFDDGVERLSVILSSIEKPTCPEMQ